mmetsp:Transcript_19313/g.33409  ORF Transcript_19313/g.33409 Transcript_19313/m.33409 type:complete len:293 (+) Transcript_19313:1359-2237(+)
MHGLEGLGNVLGGVEVCQVTVQISHQRSGFFGKEFAVLGDFALLRRGELVIHVTLIFSKLFEPIEQLSMHAGPQVAGLLDGVVLRGGLLIVIITRRRGSRCVKSIHFGFEQLVVNFHILQHERDALEGLHGFLNFVGAFGALLAHLVHHVLRICSDLLELLDRHSADNARGVIRVTVIVGIRAIQGFHVIFGVRAVDLRHRRSALSFLQRILVVKHNGGLGRDRAGVGTSARASAASAGAGDAGSRRRRRRRVRVSTHSGRRGNSRLRLFFLTDGAVKGLLTLELRVTPHSP